MSVIDQLRTRVRHLIGDSVARRRDDRASVHSHAEHHDGDYLTSEHFEDLAEEPDVGDEEDDMTG